MNQGLKNKPQKPAFDKLFAVGTSYRNNCQENKRQHNVHSLLQVVQNTVGVSMVF